MSLQRKDIAQRPPKFVVAYGPWRWFLAAGGYSAITMPWRSIYVLRSAWHSEELRFHELIHIEQLARDGTVRFCALYLWYLIRYGYRDNPYEIEAYDRTGRAFSHKRTPDEGVE